jgi:hypothetical protein
MNNRQVEGHLPAPTSSSTAQEDTEASMTPNTAVVLCAVAALIVIVIFLESRIRRLSIHVAPRSAPLFRAVPRQPFDNFVKEETLHHHRSFLTAA